MTDWDLKCLLAASPTLLCMAVYYGCDAYLWFFRRSLLRKARRELLHEASRRNARRQP